jgi:hypothetical protein
MAQLVFHQFAGAAKLPRPTARQDADAQNCTRPEAIKGAGKWDITGTENRRTENESELPLALLFRGD